MIRTTNFSSALYSLIGERIKELRTHSKLSQEELASKTGISRTSIANIEAGRHQAPLHLLYSVFDALNSDIYINLPSQSELDSYLNSESSEFMAIIDSADLNDSSKNEVKNFIHNLV